MPDPQTQTSTTPSVPMSQKDFADKLRAEVPELKDFKDDEIVRQTLKRRPDLVDKIQNPMAGDAIAAKAQQDAQNKANVWFGHPKLKALASGAVDTLPA